MTSSNRRRVLGMIVAGSLAPALITRASFAAVPDSLIAPPTGRMLFQRTVTRQLSAEAQISVCRKFTISFHRFADGFIVEGEQMAVEVKAPANLAVFADLERQRVESVMFPLVLDPFGQIRPQSPQPDQASQVELAFDEALHQINARVGDSAERSELHQFISALHQAGNILTATMPTDLFSPQDEQRSDNQILPLPGGDLGRVSSRFEAERDLQTGLMSRAMREVMTEIEGDQRQTTEHWQLT